MKKILLFLTSFLVCYSVNAQQGKQASPGEYVPSRVIVKFKAGLPADAIASVKAGLKKEIQSTKSTRLKLIDAELWEFSKGSVQDLIAKWRNDPRIKYIEPDYIVHASVTPNDSSFASLWGMAKIQAPAAWDITTGTNVLVGVMDAGVDYNHPDLAANIWTNPGEIPGNGIDDDNNGYVDDVHGYDFVNNDGDPLDDNNHGTHVAGTIAAVGDNGVGVTGVNWTARIMALKILNERGSGSTSNVILAVDYATKMGVQLTNNSYGANFYSQALYDAIHAAGTANCLFVAAAGNNGANNDTESMYPASFDLDNIISVAATDRSDLIAPFSNYGATTVDLGAPGVGILSTYPTTSNFSPRIYIYLTGTSMASPHVAGVAALIWSLHPTFSVDDVKEIILGSVDTVASLNGITVSGGRLNAYNAVTRSQTWTPLPSPVITVDHTAFPVILNQDANTTLALSISNQAGSRKLWWNITDPGCSWLSVNKLSGTTLGGATDQVQLTINAFALNPGNYQCSFHINSNDPNNPVIEVVVNLVVNFLPPPVAAVLPDSMFFTLNTGENSTDVLTIYNNAAAGSRNLHWSALLQGSDIGWLSINSDTGVVAAQNSQAMQVTANATGLSAGVYQATLEITSNDLDRPDIQIPVVLTVVHRAYVNTNATGAGNGTSWADAFTSLQPALSAANTGHFTEIWVAAGTYQPASGESFAMVPDVEIYGGFAGTETVLEQRNRKTNTTILKGNGANVIRNYYNGLTPTAVLDGFTITGGNAPSGGGITNEDVSPTINNCILYNNHATEYGGGMFNYNASVTVQNTLFYGNSAGTSGAEICNYSGNGNFRNITVISDAANTFFAFGYTFWYNSIVWGTIDGTGYSATNCLFKGSSSTANGNIDATGLTDVAIFNNPVGNDYTLEPNSPCVNKGNNSFVVGSTDLNGNNRIINNTVDIGAYEALPLPVTATLQADTAICQQTYTLVTFKGTGGIAPYTFAYSVNGEPARILTTQTGDTVSVVVPSGTTGVVTYTLLIVTDDLGNTASVDSTIFITIKPLHMYFHDADGDGFGDAGNSISECSALLPAGYVTDSTDCDDGNAAINPLTVWVADADNDDYYTGSPLTQCASPGTGYLVLTSQQPGDCDDTKANVYPKTWYRDADSDSYGNTADAVIACTKPVGYVSRKGDCSDNNIAVNPGATEICDGIDNNCNSTVDEGFVKTSYYRDADGDGYGDPVMLLRICSAPPAGYVTNKADCNDANALVHPGAIDICDGIDNDCNDQVDEDCRSISIVDVSVTEGNTGQKAMSFAVTLNKANNSQSATVNYTTQDGTATAGSDYTAKSGTISFLPGVKKVVVQIAVNGDRIPEPNETFNVVLSNPLNAGIADGTGTGTIIDNDNTGFASAIAESLNRSVLLSPNPASDKVCISLNGYSRKLTLLLRTKEGKVLREDKVQLSSSKMAQQQEIDVSKYAAGVYLLTIIDENGKQETQKLLIAR